MSDFICFYKIFFLEAKRKSGNHFHFSPELLEFWVKKWVRGVREGGFALDPPSQHSLAQGGEEGKDAFWILLVAKRVPHKI